MILNSRALSEDELIRINIEKLNKLNADHLSFESARFIDVFPPKTKKFEFGHNLCTIQQLIKPLKQVVLLSLLAILPVK